MKRQQTSVADEGTSQFRKHPKTDNKVFRNLENNAVQKEPVYHKKNNNDLKEINVEPEVTGDLPLLNDYPSNEIINLNKRISELEKQNTDLNEQLTSRTKRHERELEYQQKNKQKLVDKAYAEKRYSYHQAKKAATEAEEYKEKFQISQTKVQKKEAERLRLQHQLNESEKQNEELRTTVAGFSQNEMINDSNTAGEIAQLRQSVLAKEKTIKSLEERLEKGFEESEEQKDRIRETLYENEKLKKSNEEHMKAAKTLKASISTLESQLDELRHEKRSDQDQMEYENSCLMDTLNEANNELRNVIKEKNQQIAQLQKDVNVQALRHSEQANEEVAKATANSQKLERSIVEMRVKLSQIQNAYDDLKNVIEAERNTVADEKAELISKNEKSAAIIKELSALNEEIMTEKDNFHKCFEESQMQATQLHQEKLSLEELVQKLKAFVTKAYEETKVESERADSLNSRVESLQVDLLNALATMNREKEHREVLQQNLDQSQKELAMELITSAKATDNVKTLETEISLIKDELAKANNQYSQMKVQRDEEKKEWERDAAKNKTLETQNNILASSNAKLEGELTSIQKELKLKQEELQQLDIMSQNMSAFCKKAISSIL